MNGTQSSLDLLMDEKRLERLYASAGVPGRWTQAIKLMGLANPRIRILEVGGGTGAYTRKTLEDLQSAEGVHLYSQYVFTDISPGFTVAAQEEFGSKKNVEFKVLDISQEIEKQGFAPHSFDLVIASNVRPFQFSTRYLSFAETLIGSPCYPVTQRVVAERI
jgi:ubiquinone/menaquinone biosynthesis C-methylase UbiE